jgi:CRISPR-associated protein Cas1
MKYAELVNTYLLRQAFEKVKKNSGAPGFDDQSIADFELNAELGLAIILSDLETQQYQPQPLKKSILRLPGKKDRALAFPTVRDRIVHTAIAIMLTPYFETEFEHNSYGYRPGRSYLMAVDKVIELRDGKYHHVFDADIASYFNNIPQQKLFEGLRDTQIESALIDLIFDLLLQHQEYQGELVFGTAKGLGIPQGSAISPLLSNFYLDPLDEMLIEAGYQMVRYADDFVVCCQNQLSAQRAQMLIEQVLTSLGLELNWDKTRLTTFEQGFRFLGHFFLQQQVIDEKSNLLYGSNAQEKELALCISEQHLEFEQLQADVPASHIQKTIEDDYDWYQVEEQLATKSSLIKRTRVKTLYLTQVGAMVGIRGNRARITLGKDEIRTIPLSVLDVVMVMGRVQLTTDFLSYCTEHQIPIILSSSTGRYKGEVTSYPSNTARITTQILFLHSWSAQRPLTETVLKAKFANSDRLLSRAKANRQLNTDATNKLSDVCSALKSAQNKLVKCKTRQQFFLLEAQCAKAYFAALRVIVDPKWQFFARNRLPPKDPVNALLSLGYSLLFNNMLCLVRAKGLHPNIGFLHSGHYQPSLVLDLMEPFRSSIIDTTVLMSINKGIITPDDFVMKDQQCLLTKTALSKFIQLIENKLTANFTDRETKSIIDYRKAMDLQIKSLNQLMDEKGPFEGFTQV